MARIKCAICEVKLKETYLERHIRRRHSDVIAPKKNKMNITCCLCQEKFSFRNDFRAHVETEHAKIEEKSFKLEGWKDFLIWLKQEENKCNLRYIKRRQPRLLSVGVSRLYYYCQYDNAKEYRLIPPEKRLRALKHQGSYKLSGCCPAEIIVDKQVNDGQVKVKYFSTHIGHESSTNHFYLHPEERLKLAEKIKAGMSFTEILNDVQKDIPKNEQKNHIINRKTLHNIASSLKINTWKRDADDAANVSLWVERMKLSHYNPVCLFKMQGDNHAVLDKNDFVLVLVTEIQAMVLKEYGNRLVCIDCIRGRSLYEFFLTVILTVDENEEVFPAAYLLSNRTDETLMEIFFEEIRSKISMSLSPTVFVSDDIPDYYNAWIKIMNPEFLPDRLLSSWQVDKNWLETLSKLSARGEDMKEKRDKIHHKLRALLEERDETMFASMLNTTVDELLSDRVTRRYGEYLLKTYAERCNLWAYCFRDEAAISTSVKLENFHQLMETVYNEGIKTKRLDQCIDALLQVAKDEKRCQKIMKLVKAQESSALQELYVVHQKSSSISDSAVVVAQNDSSYSIKCETDSEISFIVRKINENCPSACDLTCPQCDACAHLYQCSCTEFIIKGVMCEHIHKICQFRKSKEGNITVSFPDSTLVIHNEHDEATNLFKEEVDESQANNFSEFDLNMKQLSFEMSKKIHSSSQINLVNDLLKKAISILTDSDI